MTENKFFIVFFILIIIVCAIDWRFNRSQQTSVENCINNGNTYEECICIYKNKCDK